MCTVAVEPLLNTILRSSNPRINPIKSKNFSPFSVKLTSKTVKFGRKFCSVSSHKNLTVTACSSTATVAAVSGTDDGVLYNEIIQLARVKKVEQVVFALCRTVRLRTFDPSYPAFCSINPYKNLTVTACSTTATVAAVSGTDHGVLYNEIIELARVQKVEQVVFALCRTVRLRTFDPSYPAFCSINPYKNLTVTACSTTATVAAVSGTDHGVLYNEIIELARVQKVEQVVFALCRTVRLRTFDPSYPAFCSINPYKNLTVTACSTTATVAAVSGTDHGVLYNEIIELARVKKVEGKICIRLNQGKDEDSWQLTVGCTLPGKWVLHWGVHYVGVVGSEWDQPPEEIRPPGSIAIKDYAIETPLSQSTATEGGDSSQEVNINFNCNSKIAAINFVLKDEETGSWYQHKGRDFVVPLVDDLRDGDNVVGQKRDIGLWPGSSEQLSNLSLNGGAPQQSAKENDEASSESPSANKPLEGFDVELPIVKQVPVSNSLSVSVKKCPETSMNLVHMETDLPGNVVVHWGVCFDNSKIWKLPETPHPPETEVFKNKALRTQLQKKEDGLGAKGVFSLNEDVSGFPFALKLDDDTWLNNKGDDFFIPLSGTRKVETIPEDIAKKDDSGSLSGSVGTDEKPTASTPEAPDATYTDEIIKDIRTLVTGISSEKKWKTKTKEAQEGILQEIEKLAAEAYSIFRSSSVTFSEESILEIEAAIEAPVIRSGTGSGFEILCQGFNWESHKSGKWYLELQQQAAELSSLGFTVVWFPPPTESVSPEGYMPKDLYNLNSRYGTIDELKEAVKQFHKVGIKVLGDAVLNHRCAHSKNGNGIWNIFGGRLNWDDRAVVADDPHFQGRGNKSSGDNFHAAPNIDHSQDFVRNDIKEWLCWLRKDIGYDGWRLDFVRGFWGGYVKDYIDASTPYFAVGEYWDSLSYSYGEMDYDQDAHRQRIVDWINATGGTAGAFDVTTKGILHAALERCEYWRLTDSKGKPPGVVGWWPSRAITFIENHDTGSTQGHWRFPGGKEMQGYAYILTHPGTPSVFYDHVFHYKKEIAALLALRNRKKISCRSTIKITKADRDVYAAVIDDKVAMKIGPGHYEPPSESQNWSVAAEGNDYKVWETV